MLLFLSCQGRWDGRKGGVVEKCIHALKLSSRKWATAPLKQNTCRCAGAPAAPRFGCCICFKLKSGFFSFFCGEAATLENHCVLAVSTAEKASGCCLGAFCKLSGGALAAPWRAFACALGAPSAWPASPASRPTGPARITMASLPAAGLPLRQSRSQAPGRPGSARPTRHPEALR